MMQEAREATRHLLCGREGTMVEETWKSVDCIDHAGISKRHHTNVAVVVKLFQALKGATDDSIINQVLEQLFLGCQFRHYELLAVHSRLRPGALPALSHVRSSAGKCIYWKP